MTVTTIDAAAGAVDARARFSLAAAVLGFLVVTLDAVVVNVALPSMGAGLGTGVTGLQWIVDGYALTFAALLLAGGALADRVGARRAFGLGIGLFVVSSVGCGAAPTLPVLVASRFVQGAAAAMIMPASLTLISQAYPQARRRARAVAVWALGGSVASTSGPLLGGVLTWLDWRWIFFVNVPVGAGAVVLLRRATPSFGRSAPFDWAGQISGFVAVGALTYAAIAAGSDGVASPRVVAPLLVAVAGALVFVVTQMRVAHPMLPLHLFRSTTVRIALGVGFAFMVGFYGLPFVFSLSFQGSRGLTAFETGLTFVPMMLVGLVVTPFSARIVERVGARRTIVVGLLSMTLGLGALAALPSATPIWALSAGMTLVGLGGPLVMPPLTAVLLDHVPPERTGVAGGAFNTSRQIGGALAVAVFGSLLAHGHDLATGVRASLVLAAVVLLAASLVSVRLPRR